MYSEVDQRHAEICIQDFGLSESSREIGTPVEQSNKLSKEPKTLELRVATRYRSAIGEAELLRSRS